MNISHRLVLSLLVAGVAGVAVWLASRPHDDTRFIQSAIDAARGSRVVLPNGTYNLMAPVRVPPQVTNIAGHTRLNLYRDATIEIAPADGVTLDFDGPVFVGMPEHRAACVTFIQ